MYKDCTPEVKAGAGSARAGDVARGDWLPAGDTVPIVACVFECGCAFEGEIDEVGAEACMCGCAFAGEPAGGEELRVGGSVLTVAR